MAGPENTTSPSGSRPIWTRDRRLYAFGKGTADVDFKAEFHATELEKEMLPFAGPAILPSRFDGNKQVFVTSEHKLLD